MNKSITTSQVNFNPGRTHKKRDTVTTAEIKRPERKPRPERLRILDPDDEMITTNSLEAIQEKRAAAARMAKARAAKRVKQ